MEPTLVYDLSDKKYYIYMGSDYYSDTSDPQEAFKLFQEAVEVAKGDQ